MHACVIYVVHLINLSEVGVSGVPITYACNIHISCTLFNNLTIWLSVKAAHIWPPGRPLTFRFIYMNWIESSMGIKSG